MITRDQAIEQIGALRVRYTGPTSGIINGYELTHDAVKIATSDGDITVPRLNVHENDPPATPPREPARPHAAASHDPARLVSLSTELRFLLSVIQSGEQLSTREIAVIRGDIHEAATIARHALGPEQYAKAHKAAKEALAGVTDSPQPPRATP